MTKIGQLLSLQAACHVSKNAFQHSRKSAHKVRNLKIKVMKQHRDSESWGCAFTFVSSVLPSPAAWKSKTLYSSCHAVAADRTTNASNSTKVSAELPLFRQTVTRRPNH